VGGRSDLLLTLLAEGVHRRPVQPDGPDAVLDNEVHELAVLHLADR